jgi:hypothetical protein
MKTIFCWIRKQWLSKFVDSKDDLLVRVIDAAAGSNCKYCTAVRMYMLGLGIGLIVAGGIAIYIGIALHTLALLMTLGERFLLCELKEKE